MRSPPVSLSKMQGMGVLAHCNLGQRVPAQSSQWAPRRTRTKPVSSRGTREGTTQQGKRGTHDLVPRSFRETRPSSGPAPPARRDLVRIMVSATTPMDRGRRACGPPRHAAATSTDPPSRRSVQWESSRRIRPHVTLLSVSVTPLPSANAFVHVHKPPPMHTH